MTVLITGAAGGIGQVLWNGLPDEVTCIGLDLQSTPAPRTYVGDCTDAAVLDRVLNRAAPVDAIVHLAADSRVESPWPAVHAAGIEGTQQVLAAAVRHGVPRVVYASSNHVVGGYEVDDPLPGQDGRPRLTAQAEPRPDSLYAVGKLAGEALGRYYAEQHGLGVVCLRIGSVRSHDDPTRDDRLRRTWLSHRDLIRLTVCSLRATVDFGIYYGVSANALRMWSLANARADLGYLPADNAAEHTA
ncbi:MAG: NAD-dependent epimerase/dehydratase family protein [Bacteroidetes bacterium]|nr:NAD-dependent epimerase/dehydratase family protein [Bacteroidota bacterium]